MKPQEFVDDDITYIFDKFHKNSLFENKVVVITGYAGFLGYLLSQYFLSLHKYGIKLKKLYLLDNFLLGRPKWTFELGKQADFPVYFEDFNIIKDDLSGISGIEDADYVLHLASIASPTFYRRYPLETVDANVWGLRKLLDCYCEREIQGLLFFSSSEIYGDPAAEFIPTSEEYRGNVSCVGPRACYDEAKRFGETICAIFAEKHKMPIGVARPFNNYGPGMSIEDKRVPADFAKAVLANDDIVIFSDGSPTRTYCYVADAIVGYLKIITYGKYDYFNIGIDGPEISVMQLASHYQQVARDHFGYTGNILYQSHAEKNYLTDNPSRRCPDISKARTILGYSPSIGIEAGIERYLKHLGKRCSR